ncbi:membrane-bound H(+)-translocating inorganic pyrophosphatase, vacuolar-type [Methanocella conradii HZ254]|uniref:K(+)-insensitive pyrophosphate-energized proton pump n=1 Tax=Methanocella conradii (strain DSM 24694 / JCM 17849 / CGMCC 1.5162 / HZ254) TaxID=1041930 RepID=H8I622_METCZ|nr:sodium-translocating pyrophosphatase [Methanocella conradii]AFD00256.1 membrane-bound H(+)-translocating inorganic pyrophosphatase, vacuolar-type [Methanocella conradii HZ254]
MDYTILAPIAGILALIAAGYFAYSVLRENPGTERMRQISGAVQEGAMAFLNRQYRTIAIFAVIIFIILGFAISWYVAGGFVLGAVLSAAAGYIGMNISVRSNVRTAEAAKGGLAKALSVAVRGGSVTGLAVVGLGLLGISGVYLIAAYVLTPAGQPVDLKPLVGLGFGASLISLFARVGGGIYTKAADVGADLVGKVEAGIPEDDPRNPAVIADNVGDNVGDCAGMGADLFETYIVTALAAILLGSIPAIQNSLTSSYGLAASAVANLATFPLLLGAAAIIATIISIFFIRLGSSNNIMGALYKGLIAATVLSIILFYVADLYLLGGNVGIFIASLVGLGVMAAIFMITEYYTGTGHRPVNEVAKASVTGAGTNIITGIAMGLEATALPVLVIVVGIFLAYYFAGLYGIAIAAVAMLSVTGIIVTIDSYGPITDNAGGIAEMAELPPEVRKHTDALDAVGNTTKAVTKGYAIGSAALAALALFAAFKADIPLPPEQLNLSVDNPVVLIGLFIGGAMPFLFSALCMLAVGRAAFKIVEEVRRQFKEIPGIMEGTAKPDYGKCVDIVTVGALKQMALPGLLAVLTPLVVGFILGPAALSGLLLGVIITGLMLALHMTSAGAAWDNAKKFIEAGNYGGKKSDAHKAAVVGDTVGDPYKDTAGPSLNALIKVMNTISLIFIGLITTYYLLR